MEGKCTSKSSEKYIGSQSTNRFVSIVLSHVDHNTMQTSNRLCMRQDVWMELYELLHPNRVLILYKARLCVGTRTVVECLGHSGSVNGVAAAPKSNALITASWDSTLLLWDTTVAINAAAESNDGHAKKKHRKSETTTTVQSTGKLTGHNGSVCICKIVRESADLLLDFVCMLASSICCSNRRLGPHRTCMGP